MLNRVDLIGNLARDPESRATQSGSVIVTMTIATSESWKDKNTGERKQKAEFHRVVVMSEGLAKVAEAYLRKGSKVFVSGKLQTRKWTNQEGKDQYSTEVVLQGFDAKLIMLDGRKDSAPQDTPADNGLDDEIPF